MRVPQYAKRSLVALALAALAGCSGDSTAPDAPFDPDGTSADVGAVQAAFDSPVTASYSAATAAISAVLGETAAAAAVRAMPSKSLVTMGKPGAEHYAARLAKAWVRPGAGLASASIPSQYLGVTFVYNPEIDLYEASTLDGAPSNGVRFIVYAVNAITGAIIEPLVEVGYADIVTTETASSLTVRVELVSENVTYLDYTVGAGGSATSITLSVTGYVTNGDDQVTFDLDNTLSVNTLSLDYTLTVPTRGGFRMDFEGEANEGTTTSTLTARGPHGTVLVTGTESGTTGSFDVKVNGEPFAIITTESGQPPVITNPEGGQLSNAERIAIAMIYAVFLQGFDFFEDLLDPLG